MTTVARISLYGNYRFSSLLLLYDLPLDCEVTWTLAKQEQAWKQCRSIIIVFVKPSSRVASLVSWCASDFRWRKKCRIYVTFQIMQLGIAFLFTCKQNPAEYSDPFIFLRLLSSSFELLCLGLKKGFIRPGKKTGCSISPSIHINIQSSRSANKEQ